MYIAYDYNDNLVHIDETHSNQEYYCPCCGAPLNTRKGEIRKHHFSHKSGRLCKDTWERNNIYDNSSWHYDWQIKFPKENQEVLLKLGDIWHRADVMIGNTVIEFQNSIISPQSFDERNNFYYNFGYRLVWLFNLTDLYSQKRLSFIEKESVLEFEWKNPKKAFNSYDVEYGCIDLFFQLTNDEDNCIVKVNRVSDNGFEKFETSRLIGKKEFLEIVGMNNGICQLPNQDNIYDNETYLNFKEKYSIQANKQQERALQAIEGSVLLLAVPGSGKTTVLVNRLGYMVLEKGITPTNILAITFTNNAAEEMKKRCIKKFGETVSNISFKTINAFCYKIYRENCKKYGIVCKTLVEKYEVNKKIRELYKLYNDDVCDETSLNNVKMIISYSKNMMLNGDEIEKQFDKEVANIRNIFDDYNSYLEENSLMDFNDQMVFAYDILQSEPECLDFYRKKYKYICVDEAQDTSKIQHKIINLLACGNNLFMVGDEDQSIYGFRAAYPKALLNFRYDYKNPFICKMETNYRSTKQVVDIAQQFISANVGRYTKNMIADRGDGKEIQIINVYNREEQFDYLINMAKSKQGNTAILFRDNESAVVLIDKCLREKIPYAFHKPEANYFEHRVVKDIKAYLKLSIDQYDYRSFEQIVNKGILYLKSKQKQYATSNIKNKHISVFEAVDQQMKYSLSEYRLRGEKFRNFISNLSTLNPCDAIGYIYNSGYESYMSKNHLSKEVLNTLKILAKEEQDIVAFLRRLEELEKIYLSGTAKEEKDGLVLSTIHASKGLEYDTVYLADVFDGYFPSSRRNLFDRSKDNANGEQEERRLFYVGITRARNNLCLFNIKNKKQSYISELFPDKKQEIVIENDYKDFNLKELMKKMEEKEKLRKEEEKRAAEERRRLKSEARKEKEREQENQRQKFQKILVDTIIWYYNENNLGNPDLSQQGKFNFIKQFGKEKVIQLEKQYQLQVGKTDDIYDHFGNKIEN